MNRAWFFVAIGLALCGGAVAVYFQRENAALRRELAAWRTREVDGTGPAPAVARTETRASRAAEESALAPSAREVAPAVQNGSTRAPTGPAADERPRFNRRDRGTEFLAHTLSDPEGRAAMLTQLKGQIDRSFGDYFVEQGLDATQIETLRTLLAERQLVRMEARMLERNAANDAERAQAGAWREAKLATTETDINAILGPEGMTNLQAHLDAAPQREVVEDVARRALYAGADMSNAARDGLVDLIRRVNREQPLPDVWSRGGRGRDRGDTAAREPMTSERAQTYLRQLEAQQRRVLDEARGFLTRPQLEALVDQQLDARQQAEARLNFMVRDAEER